MPTDLAVRFVLKVEMISTQPHAWRLILLVALSACLADPVGPGGMRVVVDGAGLDTVLVGAPGEPVQPGVRVRITNAAGTPIPGASVVWNAVGRNAQLFTPWTETDREGEARTGWVLGTDAAEPQELSVTVRFAAHETQFVIRARAVPQIVAQLRVVLDTPAVLRLGDTLPIRVNAIDPYGNVFPAPDVAASLGDSSVGAVAGASVVGGPRRGHTVVRLASQRVFVEFPLQVTQYVGAIGSLSDTIRFSSVGAELPIAYAVRDDRGRIVADTTAAISIADTTKVRVTGSQLRSLAPGATALHLALGPAAATMVVTVQQRVAFLTLLRDTVHFDALLDTTSIRPIARDSLNSSILQPVLSYAVSNGQVAKFVGGTLTAVAPGTTVVTVRDSATGISATAGLLVRQRIATIELPEPRIQFDAVGDTVRLSPVARDRLGSTVVGAALDYSVSDPTVVGLPAAPQLRSIGEGRAVVTVRDPESGAVATTVVTVAQRVTVLNLTADSLTFAAVGDTVPLGFAAWDRLGVLVPSATVAYSSSDSSVVTVTTDGVVRSHKNGSALVVGQSVDGPTDTAYVTVAQRVVEITLAQDSLLFESLHAVQNAGAVPVDRLGVTVPNAPLTYASADPAIAAVDSTGHIRAVSNGSTRILVVTAGDTARVGVRVAQRAVRVNVPADTIRFQSLGDTVTLTGIAIDSLGSPAPGGVTGVAVVDTTVVAPVDSFTVRARRNGVTQAGLTVAGATGRVVIVVDQIATTLSATVTLGSPVIALPVGALLPLTCQAFDKNGFPMLQHPTLVRSVKGTVTGAGCADARVQHSGYDTLDFALGAAQLRVPVIVSTGDSVGVVAASQPLTVVQRHRFVGEDLANPSILALRALVADILAAYGSPTTNLGRARAIRDWVARTAIHPHPTLHPDASTSNLGVLPPGKTWADVNALINHQAVPDSMFNASNAYWWAVGYDGYAMLDRLLGTLDPTTGLRADDGMMVHVVGARYQIRDIQSYRYVFCTFQGIMLAALWEAAGLQGMLISTIGHDPSAVFIPELRRWVYEDPTFNEEYLLDGAGDPLSPADLLAISSAGEAGRLRATKLQGPSFDPQIYIGIDTYLSDGHPNGMVIMGSQLNNRVVGLGGWPTRLVQIDVPRLAQESPYNDPLNYARVTVADAFPTLGVVVEEPWVEDSVYVIRLSSTFPNHQRFERRLSGGDWESVADLDVLPVGQCQVEYRSVDAVGSISASAALDAWVPRAQGFVESGVPGGVRGQARYCISLSSSP